MRLPELGVKRPVTTFMIFFALMMFGVIMYSQLDKDVIPDAEMPNITVLTIYPGASANDVEEQITKELEDQLASVPGINSIKSTSKDNVSFVMLEFEWSTDLTEATNDTRDRIEIAKSHLPDDAQDPILLKINSSMMPILMYGIEADESFNDLKQIIDDKIANKLRQVQGVGTVIDIATPEREIKVKIDPVRLASYKIPPSIIATVLKADNITIPGGNIKLGINDLSITIPGEFETIDDIRNAVIYNFNGKNIYVKDVAQVEDSYKEKDELFRTNRKNAVCIMVQKQSGANTLEVAENVKETIKKIQKSLPKDVIITELQDSSELVTDSISNLQETIGWAALFVIIVVFVFLRDFKSSIVVILTIPFSLLGTFFFMKVFGYTLNIFSEMSLAIAIGMVIDNAIVVLENITKYIEKGVNPKEASIFGTQEMGTAITASTMTTIAVFLPLLFIGGLPGILFEQLSVLTSITLLVSLFTALIMTPMLSSRFLKPQRNKKISHGKLFKLSEKAFVIVENTYRNILSWAIRKRKTVMITTLIILIVTFAGTKFIGVNYIPQFDAGDIKITFNLEQGTNTEETLRICKDVENILISEIENNGSKDDIRSIYSFVGQSETGILSLVGFSEGKNIGTVMAKLVLPDFRNYESSLISDNIADKLDDIPEIVKYSCSGGSLLGSVMTGNKEPVEIKVTGDDLNKLNRTAISIDKLLKENDNLTGITNTADPGKSEIVINIDRDKAGAMGIKIGQAALAVRNSIYGVDAGEFTESGNKYQINVRFDKKYREDLQYLNNIFVTSMSGKQIRLSEIAEITNGMGSIEIRRESQQKIIYVKINHKKDIDLSTAVSEINESLKDFELPEGVDIEISGQYEDQQTDMTKMLYALIIGIILVFMVMASQFESFIDPFIVMFSVPLAFIGVIWIFLITGTALSITAAIGVIMLSGIVVNNGIVLVDYINLLRKREQNLIEAAVNAGISRFRPVLMTALTTLFAMVPMAFSSGMGSEMWKPIGITVIGGLLVSTIITLVLIPVIYVAVHRKAYKTEKAQGLYSIK
ncbi:MAG: efflux RND transporter permease subunit [Candidatus Delongbacteria bacterium]|jgi:CzcA family heavy metal efflux pump|nr:efflux RND transporter permease subunit [Candidatus Delongbacteria bacterium]